MAQIAPPKASPYARSGGGVSIPNRNCQSRSNRTLHPNRSCDSFYHVLPNRLPNGDQRVLQAFAALPCDQGCIGRGDPPPSPSWAPSLCPATVSLTESANFNGICNPQ